MHLLLVASLLLVEMPFVPSSVLVTTSKALVTRSDALVTSSVLAPSRNALCLWEDKGPQHRNICFRVAFGRSSRATPNRVGKAQDQDCKHLSCVSFSFLSLLPVPGIYLCWCT